MCVYLRSRYPGVVMVVYDNGIFSIGSSRHIYSRRAHRQWNTYSARDRKVVCVCVRGSRVHVFQPHVDGTPSVLRRGNWNMQITATRWRRLNEGWCLVHGVSAFIVDTPDTLHRKRTFWISITASCCKLPPAACISYVRCIHRRTYHRRSISLYRSEERTSRMHILRDHTLRLPRRWTRMNIHPFLFRPCRFAVPAISNRAIIRRRVNSILSSCTLQKLAS